MNSGNRRLVLLLGFPIVCLAALPGCEGSSMKTAPVTGRITFNGKPVPQGVVLFVPLSPGPTATGEIHTDGTYSLTTFRNGDGAVLGTHKVVVDAKEDFPPGPISPRSPTPFAVVPDKYLSHATTDLTADVQHGENSLDFNLTGVLHKSRVTDQSEILP